MMIPVGNSMWRTVKIAMFNVYIYVNHQNSKMSTNPTPEVGIC